LCNDDVSTEELIWISTSGKYDYTPGKGKVGPVLPLKNWAPRHKGV